MSKKFRITINGETYEVEVEDLGGETPARRAPLATAPAAPVRAPEPQPVAKPAAPATPIAGAGAVTAPMPGTILDVKVGVGDKVESGQVVLILEAMKMENEIVAPAAGTVKAVHVSREAAVNPGDILITFE